jgi:dynein light chain Tctex-type 1
VLESLVSETSPESNAPPPFKFAVTSTIIQHKSASVDPGTRGMNSSMGAYWNSLKDGMWSYKYENAHEKGMDVVVHIVWIGL